MKINAKNEELYELIECAALFTRENGFVGLDFADVTWAFSDVSEIEFHVMMADSLENVYEKLKKRLPELKYKSAFIIFSVKQGLLASIDLAKIDAACGQFIDDYLDEDGKIIWGLYEPQQEENYRIYLFCPNNTPWRKIGWNYKDKEFRIKHFNKWHILRYITKAKWIALYFAMSYFVIYEVTIYA